MKKIRKNEVPSEEITRDEFVWKVTDDGYFIVRLLEYVILHLDDRGIQRVLRDVDNGVLATALKGLSLKVQEAFLNNLSKRLATMIREDMIFMGPVSTTTCAESANEIMVIVVKLLSAGEIKNPDARIIQLMTDLFRIDDGRISDLEALSAENELEELFRQYKTVRQRIIP